MLLVLLWRFLLGLLLIRFLILLRFWLPLPLLTLPPLWVMVLLLPPVLLLLLPLLLLLLLRLFLL